MHRIVLAALAACAMSGCSGCSNDKSTAACDAGVACATNPGAPCRKGTVACSPAASCVDASPDDAGLACGSGAVCNGSGACVACAAGAACDAGECRGAGQIACGTGAAACDSSTSLAPGTPCSSGVCSGAGSCAQCDAGLACDTGSECSSGAIACSTGAPRCQVSAVAAAGAPCDGGLCNGLGACAPDVTVSGTVDLSTDPITSGRDCAEGPSYGVQQLATNSAVLAGAPDAGCLSPGDEVMLIDLQGNPGAVVNVGVWETLRVQSIAGGSVQFTAPKARFYGDTATGDEGIDDGGQHVALVRIPGYGHLDVAEGSLITTGRWDGGLGGVLALRAESLQVDGIISVEERGYREGAWSRDDPKCTDNVQTGQGESIAGPGTEVLEANFGGSGGIGPAAGHFFVSDEPTASTPGHAQPGAPGNNYEGRDAGDPGAAYGVADGGLLTMGSGSGGNLTCSDVVAQGPVLVELDFSQSGGIIYLHAGTLTLGATGSITADGIGADVRNAAAGGSIMLRGVDLSLGTGQVSAAGGVTVDNGGTNPPVSASPGYITVFFKSSLAGTTSPPAFSQQVADP